MTFITWILIALCLAQAATFSGLNLAFFSISKLRLEMEAAKNNKHALRVLKLREDANFLLVTILWGNVAVNVLIALLSDSVMAGIFAFLFSTVALTLIGEIFPQAYFSRHALEITSLLSPLIRFYQFLLYPVAKPTALFLDKWLGKEALPYFNENDLGDLITLHMEAEETEITKMEGRGALNFLALDDTPLAEEGEKIDPDSIITLDFDGDRPVFPEIKHAADDEFLCKIEGSGKKWIVLVDGNGNPRRVLNSDKFIRGAIFDRENFNPFLFCYKPVIVYNEQTTLGTIIPRMKVLPEHKEDDVIDEDVIIIWGEEKKVVTGSDILGRLLRGIVSNRIRF